MDLSERSSQALFYKDILLINFLKSNARKRHNKKHCTNLEVSLFQTLCISGAVSSSKFSRLSPILIIATWQNDSVPVPD